MEKESSFVALMLVVGWMTRVYRILYGLLSMVPTSLFGYNRIHRAKTSLEKGSRVVNQPHGEWVVGGPAYIWVGSSVSMDRENWNHRMLRC